MNVGEGSGKQELWVGDAYIYNAEYRYETARKGPFEPLQYDINFDRHYQGFGYDCVRDDYKVIIYLSFGDDTDMEDLNDSKYAPILEMYSLKSNFWKKLEHDINVPVFYDDMDKLYFEGMCHWLGYELYDRCLVSFDLSNEVLIMTWAPLDIPKEIFYKFEVDYEWRHLLILNGSIALMSNYEGIIDLYILAEVSKKEAWTKLHVFRPIPCVVYLIGTWNMGNILFNTHDDELVWFNLSTHKIEKLNVKLDVNVVRYGAAYKESRVRINS
ncbi:hypothetical protein DEO72_LG1g2075 [Vigna unguiculata]|uniref:F-box associated beta-propeller type 3 domain-containing protein n=1 Tax=Vigna unguiculata TaxID=3917 RepID=A0A4D6KLR6_VIGUN|nr:hypothetical protein DEO72_LG1g2075 [Vigna unguiculata]